MTFKSKIQSIFDLFEKSHDKVKLENSLTLLKDNIEKFELSETISYELKIAIANVMVSIDAGYSDERILKDLASVKDFGGGKDVKPSDLEKEPQQKGLNPKLVMKGDVLYMKIGAAPIPHYCVVVAIKSNIVYVSMITHDCTYDGFEITKSRFLNGYILYEIDQITMKEAIKNFRCVYDNKLEFKEFKDNLNLHFLKLKI